MKWKKTAAFVLSMFLMFGMLSSPVLAADEFAEAETIWEEEAVLQEVPEIHESTFPEEALEEIQEEESIFEEFPDEDANGIQEEAIEEELIPDGEPLAEEEETDPESESAAETQDTAVFSDENTEAVFSDGAEEFSDGSGFAQVKLGLSYRTQAQIQAFADSHPVSLMQGESYDKIHTEAPYASAVISAQSQQTALNLINQLRYIAGLDGNVTLNTGYSEQVAAAAFLNYLNKSLSHFPARPSVLADASYDALYQLGCKGASSANLASGPASLYRAIIYGWMSDSDNSNIKKVGHRRWILSPTMGKTGFGGVSNGIFNGGRYYAMYALDSSAAGEQTNVAWPAQETPIQYFTGAWSVSFNRNLDIDKVAVKVKRNSDQKTWSFDSQSADGVFYVSNGGYGGLNGCVIFLPENLGSLKSGDSYQVTVTDSQAREELTYTVRFFDLDFSKVSVGSGKCGDNLTWKLNGNGKLVIQGTGAMYNYDTSSSRAPWYGYDSITSVEVSDGVTGIGDFAFFGVDARTFTLPDTLTSIGNNAFNSCRNLTDICIPANVVNLGKSAFYSCEKLKTVTLSQKTANIGESAFMWCHALENITVPASVQSIGCRAFYGCEKLKNVKIPSDSSLKSIGEEAFYETALTSFTIPAKMESIGRSAFISCLNLKNFTIAKEVEALNVSSYAIGWYIEWTGGRGKYKRMDGIQISGYTGSYAEEFAKNNSYTFVSIGTLYISLSECSITLSQTVCQNDGKAKTPTVTVKKNSKTLKSGTDYTVTYVNNILPGTASVVIKGNGRVTGSVTKIFTINPGKCGSLTWSVDGNGKLTISGSGKMPDYDIWDSNPAPWRSIKEIKSVVIGNGVTRIGNHAFIYGNLESVSIASSVTEIGELAFYNSVYLKNLIIPDSVKVIGEKAFSASYGLTGVTLSRNLQRIEAEAFSKCTKLSSITIPASVETIGKKAFAECEGLSKLEFSADGNLKTIGEYAFEETGVVSITLPKKLTSIGTGAFSYCKKLTNVTIPKEITALSVGSLAFTKNNDFHISGYTGSFAEEFAKRNGYAFVSIGIVTTSLSGCTVTLNKASFVYNGKTQQPAVTVKEGSSVLVKGTDYTVTYKNNSKIGTAQAVITGKGRYTGTLTKNFKIIPGTVKLGKVTSVSYNKLKITWKKVSGATGYEVYQKVNGKWKRLKSVAGTSYIHTHSSAFPVLTGYANTYSVKAYCTVNGKRIYGGYSKTGISGKAVLAAPVFQKTSRVSAGIKLQWKAVNGASGYIVQRYEKGKWVSIKTIAGGKKITYTDKTAKKGVTYKYRIKSYRTVNGKRIAGKVSAVKTGKR